MTGNATPKASGRPSRTRTPLWPLLTLALGALTACAQPPSGSAAKRPDPAAGDDAAKGQQSVGYDVHELQRRLVRLLVELDDFDDVQPHSVAKAFDLKLQPRPAQPRSLEAVGRLSNGWVFNVWAWQSESGVAPPAPLQFFFYPGNAIDPGLWIDPACFVDTTGMLAELRAAGYSATDELNNFPFHSVQYRRTSKVDVTVRVVDYRMLRGPLEGTRCLRDLIVKVGSTTSWQ